MIDNKRTSIVLGIALVMVAGMFVVTATGSFSIKPTTVANTLATGTYMTGHVETILKDSEGNVKEYRQSDNVITNNGENCVLKLLFQNDGAGAGLGSGTGTGACTGSLNEPWDKIAIGTSATKANGTNYILGSELTSPSGFARGVATTKTWTNSSGALTTSAASIVLAKTFSNNGGSSTQVTESGLFNSTVVAGSGMFARQNFTSITVGNGDSLTVQWTINVGGTQYNLQQ
jgi:hypothetical protein